MPISPPPCGRPCLSAADVNAMIRRLMGQSASPARTAEWQRLIMQWAEVTRPDDIEPAA